MLIANRGEIACRIARTARRLGVATVAIYSEADVDALHVARADEAWPIGPAPARESYLAIEKIIDVARRAGAEAVHPGYGFLAENAEFAQKCIEAGLVFIGPSPQAMQLMGSKASAKALMAGAGAPIVPGYYAERADDETLTREAARLGFPLLVKATAGGGGRGMRIVHDAANFSDAVSAARREALAAFGDGRVLIEKYLERPRHIEMQVFADRHGGVATFYERDCSIQRHHQKILEETPAPRFSPKLRGAMREAAIAAVHCVDYVGAGTVEFLVKDERFYFLEMNTRLQVEHPITEMISGLDLVEWQLRIACGERLPVAQDALTMRGAAIEARICAEDPDRDFLPSVGLIEHYRTPVEGAGVRIDDGVRSGDRITAHYDSLVAKLVVWADDRDGAMRKLQGALNDFEIVGIATNLDFLRALVRHPDVARGEYDTGFIERAALPSKDAPAADEEMFVFAAAASANVTKIKLREQRRATDADDAFSPWAAADGWRLHDKGAHEMQFARDGDILSARVSALSEGAFRLETATRSVFVEVRPDGDRMRLRVDGVERKVGIARRANGCVVIIDGRNHVVETIDPLRPISHKATTDALLSAPIPARVTRVYVKPGDIVQKGAPLIVLEAMKMEFKLNAPRDGVIESVRCVEGEMTLEGAKLITLAEEPQ